MLLYRFTVQYVYMYVYQLLHNFFIASMSTFQFPDVQYTPKCQSVFN